MTQEYDPKHGVTIVKSIVEGVNYRYDDGTNSKDLIKQLKLLPRSVKEAAVRTNHFGKDFIRQNMSKVAHSHHVTPDSPTACSPSRHSHHLRTTYTHNSPSKPVGDSPSSPSQLDSFLSLIPPNRQSRALDAAHIFNTSAQQTAAFIDSGRASKVSAAAQSHILKTQPRTSSTPTVPSSPVATVAESADYEAGGKVNAGLSAAERRAAGDKKAEMLFKRLTQENPAILEKIKNMCVQTRLVFFVTEIW